MDVSSLPAVNASLNALATAFLVFGYVCIRRRNEVAHKRCMIAALVTSTVFLASYVVYHYNAGSRPFMGQGFIRTVYFVILGTHVPLAALIVPLALITVYRGLRDERARHTRIARWTLPLWLYVSVTGVLVYLMLYQLPIQ